MFERMHYWVWLSSLPKVFPRKRIKLLDHFSSPENLWFASKKEIGSSAAVTPEVLEQLTNRELREAVKRHMENIQKNDIRVLDIKSPAYPEYLKNISDPPIVLYYKGSIVQGENMLAVVGSRKATLYGLDMAESLSCELARHGLCIVSGMARGVDSRAHKGALKAGRTIAVLGCGLDIAYPPENGELMEKIIESGAVISEYVPGVPPVPYNFPARNRIISGMSSGVVIVEASERSGSLITAEFALEQGREVFAVPGNITSRNSTGTNRLIKDGAKIVMGASDVIEELTMFRTEKNSCYENKLDNRKKSLLIMSDLEKDERIIAECIINEMLHIDSIAARCEINIQTVSSILIMLELKGIVEQVPGKFFRIKE